MNETIKEIGSFVGWATATGVIAATFFIGMGKIGTLTEPSQFTLMDVLIVVFAFSCLFAFGYMAAQKPKRWT